MAKKLFVGSLAWATTDDSLRSFFASAGNVVSANVIKDKMTGRSRGFGFVEMSTDQEAEKAKNELNGKDLDGRAIMISEAREKDDSGSSPQENTQQRDESPAEENSADAAEDEPAQEDPASQE